MRSTKAAWKPSGSTSSNRVPPTAGGSPPSSSRTVHTAIVLRSINPPGQNPSSQCVPPKTPPPSQRRHRHRVEGAIGRITEPAGLRHRPARRRPHHNSRGQGRNHSNPRQDARHAVAHSGRSNRHARRERRPQPPITQRQAAQRGITAQGPLRRHRRPRPARPADRLPVLRLRVGMMGSGVHTALLCGCDWELRSLVADATRRAPAAQQPTAVCGRALRSLRTRAGRDKLVASGRGVSRSCSLRSRPARATASQPGTPHSVPTPSTTPSDAPRAATP